MTRSQGRKPRDQDQVLLPRENEHPNNLVEVIVIWGLPQPTAWSLVHQTLSVNNRAGAMFSRLVPPREVTVQFMVDLQKTIRYSMNIA